VESWVVEVNDVAVLLEQVHLLNTLHGLAAQLLELALEPLVISLGVLLPGGLVLPPGGTLASDSYSLLELSKLLSVHFQKCCSPLAVSDEREVSVAFAGRGRESNAKGMNPDKLAKLAATVRTGGKGTVRRKKKAVHKTTTTDDKRLQSTLKRLGVNTIPSIEEVNLFKEDGNVIHFQNPKVQASISANTYVVSGHCETKKLQDLLPNIIGQLGTDNLANLKKIVESQVPAAGGEKKVAEEDDAPPLVESFDTKS